MKKTVLFLPLAAFALFSCDKEEIPVDSLAGLKPIHSFTAEGSPHTVTLYNESGKLRRGYTKVYFAVSDAQGNLVEADEISAFPEMDMGMHKHSTPRSAIRKSGARPLLFEAYYAFLMYSGQGDGTWYYDLYYTVDGRKDSVINQVIQVDNAFRADGVTSAGVIRTVTTADGKSYVVTLVEPLNPVIGLNEISALVHESTNPDYPAVPHFSLELDPRMPGMDNHSSPNNVNLSYDSLDGFYRGQVNFTMTGYWTINLTLLDQSDAPQGSLFFEIEF
jgi:hypothetical protein